VGFLAQEPKLGSDKTVREVEEGTAAIVALLKDYEERNRSLPSHGRRSMNKLIERQGELTT
jgi:hypothetical protein